ncbi:MAG: DUF3108 domain-containing protein [Rhizobacter sp.]
MPNTLPVQARRLSLTLLALAAGVALLHWLVWERVAEAYRTGQAPMAQVAVQVRTVMPVVALADPEPAVRVAKPAPPPRPAPAPAMVNKEPAPTPEPERVADQTVTVDAEPVLVAAALPAQSSLELTPVADITQNDIPVYRTKLPPPVTLGYELTYGKWTGKGDLVWKPTGNSYEARLDGKVAGMRIITLASSGGIDSAGLAPVRYTDQRRGRGEQAANFQRKAGKISFSGSTAEFPLLQGSQDRLSWMLQLAAIALAEPKRVAPGGRIVLYVIGAKGDADVWAFHVEAPEEVNTSDGKVQTVKLLREPRKPHDTRVEVWLAPSLNYLPVRAKQTTENSSWDLRLQTTQAPT